MIPIEFINELDRLLNVKSINLYLPPKVTAGFAVVFVILPSLDPLPPTYTIATTLFFI
jgi:hypothetical protein